MRFSVYLPLLLSAAFAVLARPVTRQTPPATAAWLLSAGGVISAAASYVSLTILSITLVARVPVLALADHWSRAVLGRADPVAWPVALWALAALVATAAAVATTARRRLHELREAHGLARALAGRGTELTVLDSPLAEAYAVPGRPGRIVVSTALLQRLDGAQRRALLEHERSHLRHRHHLHHSAAAVCAAANPALRRLPQAVAEACERWADEDAAAACRRGTVAEALTRAATGPRASSPMLPSTVLPGVAEVASRVRALQRPAPPRRAWPVLVVLGLLLAMTLSVVEATADAHGMFEGAEAHRVVAAATSSAASGGVVPVDHTRATP